MSLQTPPPLSIRYALALPDGARHVLDFEIDSTTMELHRPVVAKPPEWTDLDRHRCPHCPLTAEQTPQCPVALNLVTVMETLGALWSCDTLHLEARVGERTVAAETSAQRAASSIMGLVIATSGCPHTHFLKPMARFHQPLIDTEETMFRVLATYALAELALEAKGEPFELQHLTALFQRLEVVNLHMIKRLRMAHKTDVGLNAVIILDTYAKHLPLNLDDKFAELRRLFGPFLQARSVTGEQPTSPAS